MSPGEIIVYLFFERPPWPLREQQETAERRRPQAFCTPEQELMAGDQ